MILSLLCTNFLKAMLPHLLAQEESYSEVAPAKIVEPKKPSVGDAVKVKDGTEVHTGKVAGFGNKAEIEKLMLHIDAQHDNKQEPAVEGEQGKF